MYEDIRELYGLKSGSRFYLPETVKIPRALRTYCELFGGYEFNRAYNILLSPDEYRTEGGYTVFYEENGCAVQWVYKTVQADSDDPPVYQTSDCEDFYSETDRMSDFLTSMAYFQGLMGGLPFSDEYEIDFGNAQLERMKKSVRLTENCANPFMGVTLYRTDAGGIIGAAPSKGEYIILYGSKSEKIFYETEKMLSMCI